jgi:hypothetical protein
VRQDVNCSLEVLTIGSESTKIDLCTAEERCTALEHEKLQQRLDEGLYLSAADPIVLSVDIQRDPAPILHPGRGSASAL